LTDGNNDWVVTIKMIGGDDREIGEKKKYGGQNTA
jgi:hypothetical protein